MCNTVYVVKDYHMIYLKCDVLLLADIFQNFRKTCLEYYKLEPLNYITSPGPSNDAMLLTSEVELEVISDAKVLDVIKRQKRGGLCFAGSKRHVKVNNKYLKNYDDKKESNYVVYLLINHIFDTLSTIRYKQL